MLAKVWSAAVRGIDGYRVGVELDLANGLPNYMTVGLPDIAVRESRERVVSAMRNSGYDFPCRRVTVNLAPAEIRKRGTQFDLPVALGLLAASGQLEPGDWMKRYCILGELALDGSVKPVSGVLPMAASAMEHGLAGVVLAKDNASEAAAVGIASYGISSLREAAEFMAGKHVVEAVPPASGAAQAPLEDLSEVKGQSLGKRALEIAAAGGHHLLLIGPPGTGKSMLARRLPGILPPLEGQEALETAKILSVRGMLPAGAPKTPGGIYSGGVREGRDVSEGEWVVNRPFRAPHHTIPPAAFVGGGNLCRPGEISLAHRGVLFLDELTEFKRESLEALRVPLETGRVTVSRLHDSVEYPADFLLVAAMNPCPCGWKGHPKPLCRCSPLQEARYRSRLSGPLMDRIDLRVELSPLPFTQWKGESGSGESSARVRERVLRARRRQAQRLAGDGLKVNSQIPPALLQKRCRLRAEASRFLESAAERLFLSARSLDRILRVAQTIADLGEADETGYEHVAEALALSGRDAS